jgi:DNA (cytosine-5)-methyltransferase 1
MSGQVADTKQKTRWKLLDCFCGMGGVSDGFAMEGFDVTGIDIVDAPKMLGYNHKFIQADMLTLKGEDFRGFDVVWGSPPCRDFSQIGVLYGKRWKNPPNPDDGIKTIRYFLKFVADAKPTF